MEADGDPAAGWDISGRHLLTCTAAEGPPIPGREPADFDCWREVAPMARLAPRGLAGLLSKDGANAYQPLDTSTMAPNFVLVNVYDIGDAEIFQRINKVSTVNDSVLIGGVYHAGVEVYGAEWSYGFTDEEDSGVYAVPPRCASQHTYRATCLLGPTRLSEEEVGVAISQLREKWLGLEYSLLHHNCLDFANALCAELGVGRLPGWVDRFGRTASSLDNFRHRVGNGVNQTKQLARTVSTDVEHMLRGVGSEVGEAARREAPRIAEAARREAPRIAGAAQALGATVGASVGRWGRGLLGAAARALGDDRASRERRGQMRCQGAAQAPRGEATLRSALRNRGGLRRVPRGGRGQSETGGLRKETIGEAEDEDDAFLLGDLSPAAAPAPEREVLHASTVDPAADEGPWQEATASGTAATTGSEDGAAAVGGAAAAGSAAAAGGGAVDGEVAAAAPEAVPNGGPDRGSDAVDGEAAAATPEAVPNGGTAVGSDAVDGEVVAATPEAVPNGGAAEGSDTVDGEAVAATPEAVPNGGAAAGSEAAAAAPEAVPNGSAAAGSDAVDGDAAAATPEAVPSGGAAAGSDAADGEAAAATPEATPTGDAAGVGSDTVDGEAAAAAPEAVPSGAAGAGAEAMDGEAAAATPEAGWTLLEPGGR